MKTSIQEDYALSTTQPTPPNPSSSSSPSTPQQNTTYSSPLTFWLYECAWPGLGLFGESYLLFSVGTLKPLWTKLYPDCFSGITCSSSLLHSTTYAVVIGVIIGMIFIGVLSNMIGRRLGSIITASFMAFGSLGLVACSFFLAGGDDVERLLQSMSVLLMVFGVGVGGEYPLSASSASERSMMEMRVRAQLEQQQQQQQQQQHGNVNLQMTRKKQQEEEARGKRVLLVFTMQGMGILLNAITLTLLLYLYNPNGWNSDDEYTDSDLLSIWRIVYAIGASVLSFVLVSRILYLEESKVWMEDREKRQRMRKEGLEGQHGHEQEMEKGRGGVGGGSLVQMMDITNITKNDQHKEKGFIPPTIPPLPSTPPKKQTTTASSSSAQPMSLPPATSSPSNNISPSFSSSPSKPQNTSFTSIVSSMSINSELNRHHDTHVDMIQQYHYKAWEDGRVDDDDDDDKCDGGIGGGNGKKVELNSNKLLFQKYGIRLLGTSLSWLLWDVAFYGNKLFQSSFLVALTGEETTLLELSAAVTLNAIVALLGYFAAAFAVDNPNIGRLKLQEFGFLLTGTLFILCGFLYHRLSSGWLVVMYFGSSFFGQCGPNATTFLIPAEVFPTEMRTMCHGISASAGKVGALLAAILFNYAEETHLFLISGYTSFAACVVTFISIPETTTLDLYEIDKKWQMTVEGRGQNYHGEANDPEYLSFYERQEAGLRF